MRVTAEPRSDQINAEDFIGRSATFTIAGVKTGSAEQKYDIKLAEIEGRVWRPPLTVLRMLIAAWGDETDAWIGRRVTLYCDPHVTFGRDEVGGIRISHMSDLPGGKPFSAMLTIRRGQRAKHAVEPLPDAPLPDAPRKQPIDADTADAFLQDFAQADTEADLKAVAADLAAWDLGAHRDKLLRAYEARQAAIAEPDTSSD